MIFWWSGYITQNENQSQPRIWDSGHGNISPSCSKGLCWIILTKQWDLLEHYFLNAWVLLGSVYCTILTKKEYFYSAAPWRVNPLDWNIYQLGRSVRAWFWKAVVAELTFFKQGLIHFALTRLNDSKYFFAYFYSFAGMQSSLCSACYFYSWNWYKLNITTYN